MNISERKRSNSIWKKDFYSKINKKYKYVLILLVWPQIHGKLGLKIGLDFSGASKTLFLTLFAHIFILGCSKTTYSYSARRDLSIGVWFDHIRKKNFFDYFWPKGGPLQRKLAEFFFLQIWSNHAPIDRSHRAEKEYMVFEALLMKLCVIYIKNSVFEVPEKFIPIFTPIFQWN